jgi:phosphatidylglycerol:prolipoprotein diacylglycerol transferase
LSWLRFGDVIVPCLFIGLAFGRIGCLMNGCCYGGRCEESRFALHFPATSPVYEDQIRSGELLGFRYDPSTRVIESVREGSLADEAGIQVGARVDALADDWTSIEGAPRSIPKEDAATGVIATIDGQRYRWGPDELPARALPVYPTQLISSVSGLLLCLGLCSLPMRRMRDGTVMMLGFAGYAILRFVLELIRVDEAGQFGTSLSISQWVSLVVLASSLTGLAWLYWSPRSAPVQTQPSSGN